MTEAEFLEAFEDAVAELGVTPFHADQGTWWVSAPRDYEDEQLKTWCRGQGGDAMCPIATVIRHRKGVRVSNGGVYGTGVDLLGLSNEQVRRIVQAADWSQWKGSPLACFRQALHDAAARGFAKQTGESHDVR